MIKAILIFNNHGKPRLIRFYQYFAEDMQQQIIRETFHLVSKRDDNVCNFLEGGSLIGGSDYKLIYRHYATLYFVFCVDSSESELGILDLIQVFVETLDKCFENVCELDLIFHMDKVHYILQEVVMGGMVLETNMNEIVAQVEVQNRMEKSEGGLSAAPARAVSAVKNMNLPEIPRNINIGDLNIKVPSLSPFWVLIWVKVSLELEKWTGEHISHMHFDVNSLLFRFCTNERINEHASWQGCTISVYFPKWVVTTWTDTLFSFVIYFNEFIYWNVYFEIMLYNAPFSERAISLV